MSCRTITCHLQPGRIILRKTRTLSNYSPVLSVFLIVPRFSLLFYQLTTDIIQTQAIETPGRDRQLADGHKAACIILASSVWSASFCLSVVNVVVGPFQGLAQA